MWRRDGRKFTLAGHKRNTHVHPRTIRSLLKAVGISVELFIQAVE